MSVLATISIIVGSLVILLILLGLIIFAILYHRMMKEIDKQNREYIDTHLQQRTKL